MLSTSLRTAFALSLGLASGTSLLAQAPPPPLPRTTTTAAPADPNAAAETGFRAKSLIGATISLQNGASAGTVDDFVLSHEGVVEYLIVNNGGKLVTVPWDAAKFNWTQPTPTATLSITPQVYQSAPTYTVQTYPNFYTPTYRTEVYKVYGLNPGQARRIERRIERRVP